LSSDPLGFVIVTHPFHPLNGQRLEILYAKRRGADMVLAERGVHLSREQVFRLVTRPPQRLSMDILAALCDILGCSPNDLIEVEVVSRQVRKAAGERGAAPPPVRRTTIRRPGS
jgi:DNA-binding Xre family transcriptional regulator